jgi:hypothetical protein
MNGNGKVSVPQHKAPAPGGSKTVTKGGATKGFGGKAGHLAGHTGADASVSTGATKRAIKGFSGSGVRGGKV